MHLSRLLMYALLSFAAITAFSPQSISAQASNSGQSTNQKRLSPFLSATVGLGSLSGGTFVDRGKVSGELTIGVQRRRTSNISHLAGLALGALEWRGGHDAVCKIAVGGGCVPTAPETRYAAFLAGAQFSSHPVTIAGMVGPGTFGLSNRTIFSGKDPNATTVFGAMMRADVWFRVVSHLEVGGSASMRIIPAYRHERLHGNSVSTGIRAYW